MSNVSNISKCLRYTSGCIDRVHNRRSAVHLRLFIRVNICATEKTVAAGYFERRI